MEDVKIAKGYIPGSIGRVAELHGVYYIKYLEICTGGRK